MPDFHFYRLIPRIHGGCIIIGQVLLTTRGHLCFWVHFCASKISELKMFNDSWVRIYDLGTLTTWPKNQKCSKFDKAEICQNDFFSFKKRQVHIFNMSATWGKFQINYLKTVGGVGYINFLEETDLRSKVRTDRRTRVKYNVPWLLSQGHKFIWHLLKK